MKRSTLQILLILVVSAAAISRLFHISNTSWLKLAGGVAFIILIIFWLTNPKKKREDGN